MSVPTTISIDGVDYVRADSVSTPVMSDEGYVVIRSARAGVFAGNLIAHREETQTVELKNARRLWRCGGAASLSQLAVDGTSKPNECTFTVAVPSITIAEVLEVITATARGRASIEAVPVWKA